MLYALLGVAMTPEGIVTSGYGRVFLGNAVAAEPGSTKGILSSYSGGVGLSAPQLKALVPALPGHQGVRFYGVGRAIVPRLLDGTDGNYRPPVYNPAIWYPGYRDRDYPFKFRGEDITTVVEKGEVWVVGAYDSGRTIVLRACPPLQKDVATEP